jgi:hypothetical protein
MCPVMLGSGRPRRSGAYPVPGYATKISASKSISNASTLMPVVMQRAPTLMGSAPGHERGRRSKNGTPPLLSVEDATQSPVVHPRVHAVISDYDHIPL